MDVNEVDIFQSALVPKHEILSEEEKLALFEKLKVTEKEMPKVKLTDPVIKSIGAIKGNVIKIMRKSPTAGEYIYYRVVI